MSGRREYGTPVEFAAYVGGLCGLDAAVNGEGDAVIRASAAAVRDAGETIAERGYDVQINDDAEPPQIVVSPSEADLRAVAEAHEGGIPEPGEALSVVDPVDRGDGDGGDAGGEPPESRSFVSEVVEVEVGTTRNATPQYQVHVSGRSLEADRVRVDGLRLVLPGGGSAAFECDGESEKLRVAWHVEQIDGAGERVVEVTRGAGERVLEITRGAE